MEKRFVRSELDMTRRLASHLSDLLYAKEDMARRFDMVENGNERIEKLIDDTSSILSDILATAPNHQRLQFKNSLKDYRVELIPKLTPGSSNVLMTKQQVKDLINLAQEKCKTCLESAEQAKDCPLAKMMDVTALPDTYDSVLCPYSRAEWAD